MELERTEERKNRFNGESIMHHQKNGKVRVYQSELGLQEEI
jgi:hypothetical protein